MHRYDFAQNARVAADDDEVVRRRAPDHNIPENPQYSFR
jgi:hypothetical protein